MLARLNEVNDVTVRSVFDDDFCTFGKVLDPALFAPLTAYLETQTAIPEAGNVYVASDPSLEALPPFDEIEVVLYGGMPIQIGYCNGRNTTYNGFEYHKGSEINVAATDLMLVLGHTWQIKDNCFHVGDETVFFVPKGTAIELFQTTLHLSPCRVCDAGFKTVVILPRGTNTPLTEKPAAPTGEARLLLQKNKWVLSHPDREPLMKQGAWPGLVGENKELKY
ncbi:MAG: DUF4867 family protein [Clostridia bacterium]|nr:DUF4867 family protein [Clostridia bacterium]MBR3552773.1 DUF4867 family protein [Clostridia bacterium]